MGNQSINQLDKNAKDFFVNSYMYDITFRYRLQKEKPHLAKLLENVKVFNVLDVRSKIPPHLRKKGRKNKNNH